ncbi:hypothetical protein [Catenulispora subtropica]|uniref:Uncharacterized protein n=1 Tax=Catenulispora subtropica TaxID=450798 RepID=A0ABP5E2C9_9ACTN
MEQRDELEIETRLRAALTARSELVTHSTLRPGIPPNEHTAGLKAKRAGLWSWRRFLVPATVAAALVGGVFVGAQLPDDKSNTVGAGSGGTSVPGSTAPSTAAAPDTQATQPSAQGAPSTESSQSATPTPAAAETSVATLHFALADGWQVAPLDATSACVTPKAKAAGAAPSGASTTGAGGGAAAAAAGLPCGVDALYLKSDAASDAWPRSTATKATGWWPKAVDAASDITCPTAKPGSADKVQDSMPLRSSAKYVLGGAGSSAGAQTAVYHEWAVTCDQGSGVRPMLWELVPAGGTAGGPKAAVVTVVSSDPAYDAALLGMVGSLHLAG